MKIILTVIIFFLSTTHIISNDTDITISNVKVINKSYLGFITVSFIFIICYLFYQQPEIFVGKNTKFEQEFLIIVDYIDILITNFIYFIEKQLIK